MKIFFKTICWAIVLGFLSACVHHYPVPGRNDGYSGNYYNRNHLGYSQHRYTGYRKPYPAQHYTGYNRYNQRLYCPDD